MRRTFLLISTKRNGLKTEDEISSLGWMVMRFTEMYFDAFSYRETEVISQGEV